MNFPEKKMHSDLIPENFTDIEREQCVLKTTACPMTFSRPKVSVTAARAHQPKITPRCRVAFSLAKNVKPTACDISSLKHPYTTMTSK